MGLNYYASAPTLVLPPPQPSHSLASHFDQSHQSSFPNPTSRPKLRYRKHPVPPSINYMATDPKAAGTKRRIDEVEDAHENDAAGSYAPPPKPKAEPIYGPGMTLIYPDDPGLNIAADSQTGTWAEDKYDRAVEEDTKRPTIKCRKSQRLDMLTMNGNAAAVSGVAQARPVCAPLDGSLNSFSALANPVISSDGTTLEQLKMALGVGWKHENETSARAYEKLITRHFNMLSDVKLLLKHEGDFLDGFYLVMATLNGNSTYFLFDESLRNCRSIGYTVYDFVNQLQARQVPAGEDFTFQPSPSQSPVVAPSGNDMEMDGAVPSTAVLAPASGLPQNTITASTFPNPSAVSMQAGNVTSISDQVNDVSMEM